MFGAGNARDDGGAYMKKIPLLRYVLPAFALLLSTMSAHAQSYRVQCPTTTPTHPDGTNIKCQQIAGGDGYATMADGSTTYLFGFGPLSGLPDIYHGLPGTEINSVFNTTFGPDTGTPSTLVGEPDGNFTFKGAIGLTEDFGLDLWGAGNTYLKGATVRSGTGVYTAASDGKSGATAPSGTGTGISDGGVKWDYQGNLLDGHVDARPILDVGVMNANQPAPLIAIDEDDELFLTLSNVGMIMRPDLFEQHTVHFHGYPNASAFYDGVPDASIAINVGGSFTYYYLAPDAGTYFWHCHIAPPEHLQMGMVGQLYVRPRQNKLAAGMKLYDALAQWENTPLPAANPATFADWQTYEPLRKRCGGTSDILCTTPLPTATGATRAAQDQSHPNGAAGYNYAYNDGDGSTYYDVEYPIQIHGFDPNFHFVGMTFNPESFNDMKDKYFLLNGRSYPDTVGGHVCVSGDPLPACSAPQVQSVNGTPVVAGPMETASTDGTYHASQPLPTVINIPANGKALLRISDLDVSEYQTLASLGIPMTVIGLNARLLRDMAGNNMAYKTNSITLAGGESIDVILDATGYQAGQKFYLFTPQLDHLSNDAENFGGLMTEVNICSKVDSQTKACTNTI
jgi:FtsP/CotA-like multicopper oxidase with cupredoxin domain